MKRLISLISTEGKSKEQIKKEAWEVLVRLPQDVDQSPSPQPSQSKIHPNKPQVTPATTPPAKTPRLSTEEYWNQFDKTKEHLGGAIQITNYPHTRRSKPSLSREELTKRLYQELQARYTSTPTPPVVPQPVPVAQPVTTQGEMLVQFFRKIPKYSKNKLQKDITKI